MDSLCDGDETKHEFYEGLNVIHGLNLLLFRIEKAAEAERIRLINTLKRG